MCERNDRVMSERMKNIDSLLSSVDSARVDNLNNILNTLIDPDYSDDMLETKKEAIQCLKEGNYFSKADELYKDIDYVKSYRRIRSIGTCLLIGGVGIDQRLCKAILEGLEFCKWYYDYKEVVPCTFTRNGSIIVNWGTPEYEDVIRINLGDTEDYIRYMIFAYFDKITPRVDFVTMNFDWDDSKDEYPVAYLSIKDMVTEDNLLPVNDNYAEKGSPWYKAKPYVGLVITRG